MIDEVAGAEFPHRSRNPQLVDILVVHAREPVHLDEEATTSTLKTIRSKTQQRRAKKRFPEMRFALRTAGSSLAASRDSAE